MLFVICDNASIHKAKEVKEWLETNGLMELKFLPPYAPQLNPVEVFNQTRNVLLEWRRRKTRKGSKGLPWPISKRIGKTMEKAFGSASGTNTLDTPKRIGIRLT